MSTHFKRILYGGDYNPNQWPKDIWQEDMRIFKDAHINTATINVFSWAKIQPSAVGEMEEEGIRKKPAPDMVQKALKELQVSADEAIYVGDSDVDIATAKNSGLECVSVTC